MSIFTSASGKSVYRGYNYFLNDKVSQLIKISDTEYEAFVQGSEERLIVDALDRAKNNLYGGACRVHGGGFAGTTLNIIKNEKVSDFVKGMEAFYKEEDIICLKVRGCGTIIL